MIVVDAFVVLELLLNSADAAQIAERLFSAGESLHAPDLLDVEVVQVLRRYSRSRKLSPERAPEALCDLLDLPLTRYAHDLFLDRIAI